ncbi:hypothetical protein [Vreelandella utahensis]|uniref:hypothetical protein n=1 Tax=Vreelandella halophila TaxID=86177 RepID=UPI0009874CD2|nr:hypothetical protein [Halomonas utahensis]
MIEGMNPQAANLARDTGTQSAQGRGGQSGVGPDAEARQNTAGNGDARPAQDVSVQISQQGLESAGANSGEAVPDASATDTNTAATLASGDLGNASEVGGSASSRAEATNSPDGGSVAGNQSVSANDQLGTNIDVEA